MTTATRTIRTVIAPALSVAWLLALAPPAARADDAAVVATGAAAPAKGEGAAAERAEPSLQEVLVTATRHEESLSKVPISVTALTQDAMDSRGIKDFQDIARFTPGVSIDNSGTNAISIRGISSSAGAGTTGIYINDTPIQMRSVGFNPEDSLPKTFDLERVEVLRGPQGTLFGAGAEGGAVRYLLTQPSLTATSTYVRGEASYTEYGQPSYELGVAHGQPLIDGVLGWRASIWYRGDGGWVDKVDPTSGDVIEHNINYSRVYIARLAAVWAPKENFTITPDFMTQNLQVHDNDTYWPAYSNPGAGQFNTATPEQIRDPNQYYLTSLKTEYDFAKSAIISNVAWFHRWSQTGYQGTVYDLEYFQADGWPANPNTGSALPGNCESTNNAANCPWYPLINSSGIHLPQLTAAQCAAIGLGGAPGCLNNFQTPNIMTNSQDNYVGELRWQSSDNSARLHWTVGAFWELAKEGSIENLEDPNNEVNPLFQYLWGSYNPFVPGSSAIDAYGPYYSCPTNAAYPPIPACSIYYNSVTTYDRQIAGYTELNYRLTDRWTLTLGERVARLKFNLNQYADGLENFGPLSRFANQSETASTPKASVQFQANNDNMFYATYAKGFRPGGGNAALPPYCGPGPGSDLNAAGYPNGAPLTYNSDDTQSYEIGSKNAFGRTLRIATSLYYIKWNGIQQNVYVAGACGLQFTDNLGEAVAKGGDLQAELSLGASFYMDLAVGYTSARFTQTSYPGGNPANPPLAGNGDAISGQAAIDYAPGTNPPWNVAVGPEYRFTVRDHEAFVRVDFEYQSRNPWLAAVQDPRTSQFFPYTYTLSSTKLTSMRAGVTLDQWLITPFIDNVFNDHTTTNYAFGQLDPYNPAGPPAPQQNVFTYRPRTFGVTVTWHVGH
ncbi:MAG TPA: TonB-dependent receptor [Steroidobacteraceae bacterium]|nr:TonB-dependent receptor [Steroidobacteraceae bacterium]